jgi:hypothetical protein
MNPKFTIMIFNFMPFRLNDDLSDFKDDIQYIYSANGVDLYRTKNGLIKDVVEIPVTVINLYFFEGTLITAYIKLAEPIDHLQKVREILENAIAEKAKILEMDSGLIYYWKCNNQFLGLLIQKNRNILLLYHSLIKFNVFLK